MRTGIVAGAAEPRVTFSTMSVTEPSSATDPEAYRSLMSAYVGLLEDSERWHRQVARPLVAYYTQSHVGQRVAQLHATFVRAAARGVPAAGWTGDDLDRRREELERLAPTLQQRITISRLAAVVPLGALAVGAGANHVGWLNTHGVLISWLLVVAVLGLLAADAYASWCFKAKWFLFHEHAGSWEQLMFNSRLLSEEPEPRIAFHLWMLDFGVAVTFIVSVVLLTAGLVPDRAPVWHATPLSVVLFEGVVLATLTWRLHWVARKRATTT